MTDLIQKQIAQVVKDNDIVLFMKGTPEFPQCGFSQRVSAILASYGIPFAAVNVLLDEGVRQGIKDFSDWPTIPQVYVQGEFIGGCDIISELQESGELAEILAPLKKKQ